MVLIPSKPLHRRVLLRGAIGGIGAALSLPLLEVMLDGNGEALADGEPLPVRFLSYFFGNGVRLDQFVPPTEGPDYPLTAELVPFGSVKEYVTVLTGFNSHCHPSNKITHHEGMVIFSGHNNRNVGEGEGFFSNTGGPTIDQVIAETKGVGDMTPIKSIQLGISKRPSEVDFGTTMHAVSHAGYLKPLAPEYDPQKVWTVLFDSFTPPKDPSGPLRLGALNLVRENAKKLEKRLGSADRQRLEAHLGGVAELEKKIAALPPVCEKPGKPTEGNIDVAGSEPLIAVSEVMSQLLKYAFKCDITRVASILFAEGAGNTIFADLGFDTAHHWYTHDGDPNVQNKQVHEGVVYVMERVAYLLDTFKNEPDQPDGGNLLDNTVMFCSTDCSEGISHSVDDQPMIVAGRGGGKLTHPGFHYRSKSGENPTDVLLSLRQVFDPAATEVGSEDPRSVTPFQALKALPT
ncbi:MAG: DUF1552 domain-containing protein [Deltaproteobacteria bacterium]|nr:DUF1552 domain-containing protein [Deltaproteobacteria bacterium]